MLRDKAIRQISIVSVQTDIFGSSLSMCSVTLLVNFPTSMKLIPGRPSELIGKFTSFKNLTCSGYAQPY